jgi:general secretion pathway protein D
MPLTYKIPHHPPEGADHRRKIDAGRCRSGSPAGRGRSFQVIVLAILFTVFGGITLLLPETVPAARIAGEEQPVTTAPAGSPPAAPPVAASPSAVQKNPPANAGASPVSTPSPAPASPRAVSPAVSAGSAGMPPPPAFPAGRKPAEAPPVRTEAAAAPGPPAPQSPPAPQPPVSQPAAVPPPASQPSVPSQAGRYVTIDFDNVDITVFIKFVSELTGRNFVVDDKVKGKVTVISPKKIAVDEVYKVFESVLDIYGFATVQAGEVIKVIPALDARGKNLDVRLKSEAIAPEDKIVTQILTLQHASPDEMKKVLDPLISKTSIILSYPPTGMLIITDVLSNVKRLQEIVTALDVDGVGEVISYVPLKSASAADMVKSLTAMFAPQAGRGALAPIKIVADDRTNALIILATENDTARVRQLLSLMDKEIPRGAGAIRVYYLQNAKAEDLAKVLTGLPQQQATRTGAGTAAAGTAATTSTAAFSKNVQIMADKSTNALIITADTADYLIIEDVIRKLDITRPMVYLEALIMEVNADKSFGVGVEWSLLKDVGATGVGDVEGKARNVGAVGFRGTSIIPQLSSTGTVSLPSGFSVGVIGAGITIGGVVFPNIGAVLQAYQNDSDTRILATPQLLALDNEDAEITVGSNVPYVTRQDTTTTSTTNYSSYEYKDVGVTLKVTPQINKDGFIRMKLDQSVTKVVSQSAQVDTVGNLILTPTTLKRTAKTTIVIKSGETVVIGGMIQDDSDQGTSKVPLLGDIPLLGWLFKTKSTKNVRTNLFVFITPRIIQTPEDAGKIKEEKMDYMRSIQEGTIKSTPARKKETKEKELEKELRIE